ncbi:Hypothetical protein DEACI_0324 [Acididesulfobacillus acetoxydans]|uniref:Uncharacterized protein n=1 Tax=Acididesulfobacillus acetoxydans TaxID=1561005 RepID=A0A8S0XUS9_9FIRM|nr:Hypothetical protein DEACI_0324 [Acididesulfobacillus acetoxydans]CEJ06249.1 Hypothetical protein DEACI_0697 [Acididesulfobacillus acetoxydans]
MQIERIFDLHVLFPAWRCYNNRVGSYNPGLGNCSPGFSRGFRRGDSPRGSTAKGVPGAGPPYNDQADISRAVWAKGKVHGLCSSLVGG